MEEKKQGSKGFAIVALIMGILAIINSFIPVINFVAYIFAVLGIIFGIIGIVKKNGLPLAIVGLVLAGVALILATVINAGTASVLSGDSDVTSGTNSSSNTNTNSKTVYGIGETITYKNYEITIDNVSTATEVGGQYSKTSPAEGGIYVCVDLHLKNVSDEPMSSFSFPTMKLVDSKGTKYSRDLSATLYYSFEKDPDRKALSDLNPGITVNDNDVFEISSDSYNTGEWYLLIDNKIKVKIK